jgi:integrase
MSCSNAAGSRGPRLATEGPEGSGRQQTRQAGDVKVRNPPWTSVQHVRFRAAERSTFRQLGGFSHRRRAMAQIDLFRPPRRPWNTGRIIGAKPPLKPKHVWGIRQQLKAFGKVRDLALFNCAVDAKLRGCDLVKLRVSDAAPGGVLRQRATIIQQKTGRPVPFEITDATRDALSAWLAKGRPGSVSSAWIGPRALI